jgi:hypothetical protein
LFGEPEGANRRATIFVAAVVAHGAAKSLGSLGDSVLAANRSTTYSQVVSDETWIFIFKL